MHASDKLEYPPKRPSLSLRRKDWHRSLIQSLISDSRQGQLKKLLANGKF